MGMTVAEVVRKGGPSRPTIFRIQNDPSYQPEAYTIERLAKALGVSLEWMEIGRGPMIHEGAAEAPDPYRSEAIDPRLIGQCFESVMEALERHPGARPPSSKIGAAMAEIYTICQRDGRKPTDELVASFIRVLRA